MSYNTYWCGSLEVTPPLKDSEVEALEEWLGHNDNERIITDPDVIEHMTADGWEYYTPWSPVASFSYEPELYPGVSYIEIESESGYSGIMAILLYHLLKQLKGHTVSGEISWDGDESEDIGELVVKDDDVYLCNGSVVYEEPSDATKISYP